MIRENAFKVIIVCGFLVSLANCFPGGGFKNKNDDVEAVEPVSNPNTDTVIILPLDRGFGGLRPPFTIGNDDDDDGMDESGFGGGFSILRPRFDDIFSSMQNVMKRWREDLASTFSGMSPNVGASLIPWGKIPEDAKTNSTTQEIGGHILTVNETTYNKTNEFGSTIIRVRVVDIKPKNSTDKSPEGEIIDVDIGGGEVTDSPTNKSTEDSLNKEETTARSVETVEDQKNNEIPGVLQA